jgi:hypothetical protein
MDESKRQQTTKGEWEPFLLLLCYSHNRDIGSFFLGYVSLGTVGGVPLPTADAVLEGPFWDMHLSPPNLGIWMCRGRDMNVLVMDVEGTDGRERGEDQVGLRSSGSSKYLTIFLQDFERKSALFSLASSEVLIVNLWEHQVGLYQGANMGLLKTVFEVNLGLFGKKSQER